jgi:hypothetical protein
MFIHFWDILSLLPGIQSEIRTRQVLLALSAFRFQISGFSYLVALLPQSMRWALCVGLVGNLLLGIGLGELCASSSANWISGYGVATR